MPITLDPSLPPSLYPLAWLVGSWEGSGAVHRPGDPDADGDSDRGTGAGSGAGSGDRRIEQRLECTAREDGALAWVSLVHVVDAPAPLPPTSVFTRDDVPAPEPSGSGQRTLLMREEGVWTVGDPLPGQDLEAARAAAPGDPAGVLSYALTATFTRRAGDAEDAAVGVEQHWAGEVRGPRIQLAARADGADRAGQGGHAAEIAATRMFGYVGGRLMWLWERRPSGGADPAAGADGGLVPFLSVELDRV